MGLSDIAKAPVSHRVEPHDLETGSRLHSRRQPFRTPPPSLAAATARAVSFLGGKRAFRPAESMTGVCEIQTFYTAVWSRYSRDWRRPNQFCGSKRRTLWLRLRRSVLHAQRGKGAASCRDLRNPISSGRFFPARQCPGWTPVASPQAYSLGRPNYDGCSPICGTRKSTT
jgi:hypothetical protein